MNGVRNRGSQPVPRKSPARSSLLTSLLAAACLMSGCNGPTRDVATTFPYYNNPQVRQVQRVVALPFHHNDGVGRSADPLDDALANSFREIGLFEVVVLGEEERDRYLPGDVLKASSVPSEGLRRLRSDYQADAVLVGRIESFKSYDPCATGVAAALVDCGDGTVLWSGSGHFDAQRRDVQDDIESWHAAIVGEANRSIAGWRATLQSPRLFSRYVADRLAYTVLGAPELNRSQREALSRSRRASAMR